MKVPFVDLAGLHEEVAAELQCAWSRVASSGWYVLGAELEHFEQVFAAYCAARHCVGVGNGLDALTLILRAMDVAAGCEVIVPGNTFIATWLAVSRVGAVPVPVEPDENTHNIDPQLIEDVITDRTVAIIAVDLYGHLADFEALRDIARRRRLRLIEDAAQAHGACAGPTRAGSWADATAFSFFPTKNLGCLGDGGAVVTSDDELARRVRLLRNYGSQRKYDYEVAGLNSRLDEIQAAVLCAKLPHLDQWNDGRRAVARAYEAGLRDLPELVLPRHPAVEQSHVWHLYVVQHPRRDELRRALDDQGIETGIHYPVPPHMSQVYAALGLAGSLPITERTARQALSLPIGPHSRPDAIAVVIGAVRDFCLRGAERSTPAVSLRPKATSWRDYSV